MNNLNAQNTMHETDNLKMQNNVVIKVIGIGGGGNNTVKSMIEDGINGVEFIVANTDEQVLQKSPAQQKLTLGKSARGLGAGADPEVGKNAALESETAIRSILQNADMVIIAAGMGGGTGTGASPIVAKIARDLGALTIGIVTTPFTFEGSLRVNNAREGLDTLREEVDSLIVVSNDKLLQQFGSISLTDSFAYANKVLKQTVRTITDLIAVPALINLDFADVVTIMKDKGPSLIGIGRATGTDKAIKAATQAVSSPILEASIFGAKDAIINITGSEITLDEAHKAVETVRKAAGVDLNIIFGVSINQDMGQDIQVSVIATGLSGKQLTKDGIKSDLANMLDTIELDFEDRQQSKTLNKQFSKNSNNHIDQKLDKKSKIDFIDEDENDDLPAFLRR